jgi:DoxX-like protein
MLLIGLVAIWCITAGAAKVMRLPEEMAFLQWFGFNANMVTIFGLIQLASSAMLLNRKFRTYGGF